MQNGVCKFSWVTLEGLDLHIRMVQNILEDCRVDGGNRSIRELYVQLCVR